MVKSLHSDEDIADFGFFCVLLFLSEKNNKTCWIYKNNESAKLQNTKKAETFILCSLLISVAVQWDHLTVTSLGIGFHREWIAAGLGSSKLVGCSVIRVLIQPMLCPLLAIATC